MFDGRRGEGGLLDLAKMMVSVLYQTTMTSGKAQVHEVRGQKAEHQQQMWTSRVWSTPINHTGSVHINCYSHNNIDTVYNLLIPLLRMIRLEEGEWD